MHIHTNPRQLVSSIRCITITQMLMKCEYLWTQWVVTLSIQTMITMEPNVSNHFWMDANCRSASVCLDVINQTWSPMFGNNWSFLFSTCVDIQLVNSPVALSLQLELQVLCTLNLSVIFCRSCQCVWGLPPTTSTISESFWSTEWRCCCIDDAWSACLWTKSER